MNLIKASAGLCLLAITLAGGCSPSEDVQPATVLQVKTLDEDGRPEAGVEVSVFRTLQDFNREENAVKTTTTDAKGLAVLAGIAPGTYYVNAAKEARTNWENAEITTTVSRRKVYTYTTSIRENNSSRLSAAKGKRWALTGLITNGVNVLYLPVPLPPPFTTDCLRDNFEVYYKGGKYEADEGPTKCFPMSSQVQTGTWSLSGSQLQLITPLLTQNIQLRNLTSTRYSYEVRLGDQTFLFVYSAL